MRSGLFKTAFNSLQVVERQAPVERQSVDTMVLATIFLIKAIDIVDVFMSMRTLL